MNCFLFYSILFYLSYILASEFDLISPAGRRLLLANRAAAGPTDEKKSSPPKYARSGLHGQSIPIYIRPKVSHEHKQSSYSHLLKGKDKKSHDQRHKSSGSKKKKHPEKKVNVTAEAAVKTRGLVPVSPNELERCRALLHIDSTPARAASTPATVKVEQTKTESSKKSKLKETNEKKARTKKSKPVKELKEERPVDEPPALPASPPPAPLKTKREKPPSTPPPVPIMAAEDDPLPSDVLPSLFNHSMVNRAIHFVKNMFQLSDDVLEVPINRQEPLVPVYSDPKDIEEHARHSRKLLSVDDDHFQAVHFFSRRLLTTKSQSKPKKSSGKKSKSKAATADQAKPKVGWAYRYRISRYLAAQKMQRTRKKSPESKDSKRKPARHNRNISIVVDDDDLHHSLTLTEQSPPRDPLLHAENKDAELKSFDHLTDPIAIVRAYEQYGYKPRVGWKYRYRISNYIAALREQIRQDRQLGKSEVKVEPPKLEKAVKEVDLDPELSQISLAGRKVGWAYRYRIRRKLDHLKQQEKELGIPFDLNTLSQIQGNKSEGKKSIDTDLPAVRKSFKKKEKKKKKTKKKSSSSSSETKPVAGKSQQSSSFFSRFVREPFCSFPFSKCHGKEKEPSSSTKKRASKKLRMRKEERAKQFIRTHATKLGAEDKYTERRIDERMREMYKKPSIPPPQLPPSSAKKDNPSTTATTTPTPRLRTISEVIRESPETFLMKKPSDFRSNEDIQEESNEAISERTKSFIPKKKLARNHTRRSEHLTDQSDFDVKNKK